MLLSICQSHENWRREGRALVMAISGITFMCVWWHHVMFWGFDSTGCLGKVCVYIVTGCPIGSAVYLWSKWHTLQEDCSTLYVVWATSTKIGLHVGNVNINTQMKDE